MSDHDDDGTDSWCALHFAGAGATAASNASKSPEAAKQNKETLKQSMQMLRTSQIATTNISCRCPVLFPRKTNTCIQSVSQRDLHPDIKHKIIHGQHEFGKMQPSMLLPHNTACSTQTWAWVEMPLPLLLPHQAECPTHIVDPKSFCRFSCCCRVW